MQLLKAHQIFEELPFIEVFLLDLTFFDLLLEYSRQFFALLPRLLFGLNLSRALVFFLFDLDLHLLDELFGLGTLLVVVLVSELLVINFLDCKVKNVLAGGNVDLRLCRLQQLTVIFLATLNQLINIDFLDFNLLFFHCHDLGRTMQ